MRTDWLSEKRLATLVQLRRTADAILRYNRGNRGGKERTLPHSRSRDVNEPEQTKLIAASLKALAGAGHTLRRRRRRRGVVAQGDRGCVERAADARPKPWAFGWLRAVVCARISSAPQGEPFEGGVRSTEN